MNLRALREKRLRAWERAKAIIDTAEAEGRELSTEERTNFDAASGEVESLGADIERGERLAAQDGELRRVTEQPIVEAGTPAPAQVAEQRATEQRAAFRRYLTGGVRGLTAEQWSLLERRDLQADSDVAGGFAYPDMQWVNELIQAVKNVAVMRPLCRTFSVSGVDSLGAPKLDTRPSSFTWGTELTVATADTSMAFGRRELTPHEATVYIKVSMKLLRMSAMMEGLVRDELAYEISQGEEAGFFTGTGFNQPLGVFTASALGISTGRDVSTGNQSTAIGADGLIEARYSIKDAYAASLKWIFHRDAMKQIRKLKDGDGQYLWIPGISAGQSDTILGAPVVRSENAPNTFTSGQYVGIIGDFSKYWIADSLDVSVQRLDELLALTNQVGFIGRLATDGMPILEEAFARVKLA